MTVTEMTAYQQRLAAFRADLVNHTALEVFERHILAPDCAELDESESASISSMLAEKLNVPLTSITIVGSAKLGFTLVDKDRCQPKRQKYSPFGDRSDVDVAIVSDVLFDKYWKEAAAFVAARTLWPNHTDFAKYVLRGWINPKYFPTSPTYKAASEWSSVFQSLTRSGRCGDYPIHGAIYRDMHFFSGYQCGTIEYLQSVESQT